VTVSDERANQLRRLVRAAVAEKIRGEVVGRVAQRNFKEIWEETKTEAEQTVVKLELNWIANLIKAHHP